MSPTEMIESLDLHLFLDKQEARNLGITFLKAKAFDELPGLAVLYGNHFVSKDGQVRHTSVLKQVAQIFSLF